MLRPTPPLARYLAVTCILLIIYASLHPLVGWQNSGTPLFLFVTAAWPRHYTVLDCVVNVIGYFPLGFLLVPALYPHLRSFSAACIAIVFAALLSFSLESLQNFLPNRVPSNLDLGFNVLGSFFGAMAGMRWGAALINGGRLHAWRNRLFAPGKQADFGLIVLSMWLMGQLNPEILLFGMGDLRSLLDLPLPLPYSAYRAHIVEAVITGANTVTVGLIAHSLLRRPRYWMILLLMLMALIAKSLSEALLVDSSQFIAWVTQGNMIGLAVGLGMLLIILLFSSPARHMVAAMTLFFGMALVNLAPENPYILAKLQLWHQGQFFNFNGLTRLISSVWPFIALVYLMAPESYS